MIAGANMIATYGPALVGGGVLGYMALLWTLTEGPRRFAQRRAKQLRVAQEELSTFYDGLEVLLADNSLPEAAKQDLIFFERAIASKKSSIEIVSEVCQQLVESGKAQFELPAEASEEDYRAVENAPQATQKLLIETFSAGFRAMVLSWKDTSQQFENALFSRVKADRRVVSATHKVRARHPNDLLSAAA